MRVMDLPPFPREIEIPDLEYFIRTRLNNAEMGVAPSRDPPCRIHVQAK
jgi:hypothetical protein